MMAQTDIAVVGAGPAGLHAALAAAKLGANVTLIDGYTRPGGQYFKQASPALLGLAQSKRERQGQALIEQVRESAVSLLFDTRVWAVEPGWRLQLQGPAGLAELEAAALILATGAYDRPAAFPGWTLPGVISVGAAQILLKTQGVLPGRRILVAGTGPLLLALGAALRQAQGTAVRHFDEAQGNQAQGAQVPAVLEGSRELGRLEPGRLAALWGQGARLAEGFAYLQALRRVGVPYRRGWGIVRALGEERVEGAVIARLDRDWRPLAGTEQTVACEAICIGYGFVPQTELGRLAGAAHLFRPALGGWIPQRDRTMQSSLPGLYMAGDGAGIGGAAQAAVEGRIAGLAAAYRLAPGRLRESDLARRLAPAWRDLQRERRFQALYGELFTPGPGLDALGDAQTVICRCEGVRLAQIETAVNMGAQSVGAVKGLTRAGMGECQGRICGPLLAGQVARLCAKEVAEVGSLKIRPPLQPLEIGELAGMGVQVARGEWRVSGVARD